MEVPTPVTAAIVAIASEWLEAARAKRLVFSVTKFVFTVANEAFTARIWLSMLTATAVRASTEAVVADVLVII